MPTDGRTRVRVLDHNRADTLGHVMTTLGAGRLLCVGRDNLGVRCCVWEFPPQRRTILVADYGDEPRMYRLAFPYMVFSVGLRRSRGSYYLPRFRVLFSKSPVQTNSDVLCCEPFDNRVGSSVGAVRPGVCLGGVNRRDTVYALCGDAIGTYWTTVFKPPILNSPSWGEGGLAGWQQRSREDPDFGLKVNWEVFGLVPAEALFTGRLRTV